MKSNEVSRMSAPMPSGYDVRLTRYKSRLSSDSTDVIFDDKVLSMLEEFAWDVHAIESERAYLNSLKDEKGYPFCQSIKEASEIVSQLERFEEPNHPSFRWNDNYATALSFIKREFSKWEISPLDFVCEEDIVEALPKKNTSAGFESILYGKKFKGEYIGKLMAFIKEGAGDISTSGIVDTFITVATRTQCSGAYDDDGTRNGKVKHKTRVVMPVSLKQVLIELQFSKPIQSKMSSLRWYAGGDDDVDLWSRIRVARNRYKYWTTLDYSKYDASISDWLIYDAFDALKGGFGKLSPAQSIIYDGMVRSFVNKRIIGPDRIYYSKKGVPSGSMFTQIIDSVVNRLITMTYLNSLGISDYQILCMGDDILIFSNQRIDALDAAHYYGHNFGISLNSDKVKSDVTDGENPEFLSRYWTPNGPWRHPNILLAKLMFPERWRDYRNEAKPQDVIWSYILGYGPAMKKLIDVSKFEGAYNFSDSRTRLQDSQYLTGALAYQANYLGVDYSLKAAYL